jgi:hypothetical protein
MTNNIKFFTLFLLASVFSFILIVFCNNEINAQRIEPLSPTTKENANISSSPAPAYPPCRDDKYCPEGQYCDLIYNYCVAGCSNSQQECFNYKLGNLSCCESNEICNRGHCAEICDAESQFPCGSHTCCNKDEHCDGNFCYPNKCESPNFRCGNECCNQDQYCSDLNLECIKKATGCKESESPCYGACCPPGEICSGIKGCYKALSNECDEDEIECSLLFENTACCKPEYEYCGRDSEGKSACIKKCSEGEVKCKTGCCSQGSSCNEIGCCDPGTIPCGDQCCPSDSERCDSGKCREKCEDNELSCGAKCCAKGQVCLDIQGVLSCGKPCLNNQKQCGTEGLCCPSGQDCLQEFIEGVNINSCKPACTVNEFRCGVECCNSESQVCSSLTLTCVAKPDYQICKNPGMPIPCPAKVYVEEENFSCCMADEECEFQEDLDSWRCISNEAQPTMSAPPLKIDESKMNVPKNPPLETGTNLSVQTSAPTSPSNIGKKKGKSKTSKKDKSKKKAKNSKN